MSNNQQSCPICSLDKQVVEEKDHRNAFSVICKCCGEFKITKLATKKAEKLKISYKLSAWIRKQTESAVVIPKITENSLEDIERSFPNYRVLEKQLLLMNVFESRTEYPGHRASINVEHDYPLVWATGLDELEYLLQSLLQRDLLKLSPEEGMNALRLTGGQIKGMITAKGWEYLEEHARASVISNQAFVAMSFSPKLKSAWEDGFYPAIKTAGFNPCRTDMEPHNERIDLKIMNEIKNSRFLVLM